jgi:hypothetical protein
MIGFREWLGNTVGTENVDSSKIESLYNKAKYAVKLVQLYDSKTNQKLLTNISTIANLNMSGVYGLYNSAENKDVIGPAASKTKFLFGKQTYNQYKNNLSNLPPAVVNQYKPDLDPGNLVPSDVIHVNVREIVSRFGDTKEAIIEIAGTIVHECTHQIEFRTKGKTSEAGPVRAKEAFKVWADPAGPNWKTIISAIPQLNF